MSRTPESGARIVPVTDSSRHAVRCPDCGCELVVDAATGAILSHRAAKSAPAGGKSLDSLFADLDAQKASAEERFEREKAAFADRDRLLDERFKEAMKRAEEEPDAPVRKPFEFD
jgi:hypothetical protein